MVDFVYGQLQKHSPSPYQIASFIGEKIKGTFLYTINTTRSLLTVDRVQQITLIALSIMGLLITRKTDQKTLNSLFAVLTGIQTTNCLSTFDYSELKKNLESLKSEIKDKELLQKNLNLCSEKVKELTEKISPLEAKLGAFEECQRDTSRAVDLLIEAREQNIKLKDELTRKIEELNSATMLMQDSSVRLEETIEANHASSLTLGDAIKKMEYLTNQIFFFMKVPLIKSG